MSPAVEEAMESIITELKNTDWRKESKLIVMLDDSFSLEEERDIYDAANIALRLMHLTHVKIQMTRKASA